MQSIPQTQADFTADWLNNILASRLGSARVIGCRARRSDVPGQTAEVLLLDVDYDGETDLPARMVAKVTSENPIVLANIIGPYDMYRRETSFYRELPDVGISIPDCLYEAHDPATQHFVLLMGDLAPAVSPSWAITPEQVELALSALPAFHAKWWNQETLRKKDWLVQYDDRPFFEASFEAAVRGADVASNHYEDIELTNATIRYAQENKERLLSWVASRPFTFVHGDYHAKQMFFPTTAGGSFAVIDWQFPFVAPGAWDFARLESVCMDTDDRQAREPQLMTDYVAGLQAQGISDYSQADFEDDYRYGLFVSQTIMAVASVDTDVELIKAECGSLGVNWQDAMLLRTQRAMAQWDVPGFLKRL